ncbi:UFD1-domain-containing protein [Gonapodya prolifera JEL478]|uniref:Ubiquitin fusion degradation protein 1 n=1 Tax=Gonapodya prolifera (strain JEL478) TaxID=1344416 RepID=A0A139AY39_GONPJ|nr:UFD1-domain-containing protein [Gonapodya prolifera JEL478]|eukprot:KXS21630.1 UFD1-domain-containing protein [Gonapodya prolifera JEL478]
MRVGPGAFVRLESCSAGTFRTSKLLCLCLQRFLRQTEMFRAYSVAMKEGNERTDVNFGGKILLPPSALDKLSRLHIEYPMQFQLSNASSDRVTHAGVLEFIAEEGRVYLPNWMMNTLLLEQGDFVQIKNASLPLGSWVKIQPQSVDFLDIHDPRAVLETALRSYSTLTPGDVISLMYNKRPYDIEVLEVRPSSAPKSAISIVETDVEVDFAPPVGYQEPKQQMRPASVVGLRSASLGTDCVCNAICCVYRCQLLGRICRSKNTSMNGW